MADITNLNKFLTDVADAIRTKNETTDPIPAEEFDTEILKIETGTDTSDATATAENILINKTAYANNSKITGTMPNNGELRYSPSDLIQTIPAGYTAGGKIYATNITTMDDYSNCLDLALDIYGSTPVIVSDYYVDLDNRYNVEGGASLSTSSWYNLADDGATNATSMTASGYSWSEEDGLTCTSSYWKLTSKTITVGSFEFYVKIPSNQTFNNTTVFRDMTSIAGNISTGWAMYMYAQWNLGIHPTKKTLCFAVQHTGNMYVDTGKVIADDKWHHIVFVIDKDNKKYYLYLDGALIKEYTAGDKITGGNNWVYLMRGSDTYTGTCKGSTRRVRIHKNVLTAKEVLNAYSECISSWEG